MHVTTVALLSVSDLAAMQPNHLYCTGVDTGFQNPIHVFIHFFVWLVWGLFGVF